MTDREFYRCPQANCYSVSIVVQEVFNKVSMMCQFGHALIVSRDYMTPVVPWVDKHTSDGHHTFEELYRYRLLYNAALFNQWAIEDLYDVHKSMFHHDGTVPFGDRKWFIVVAELPTGQISNHYRVDDWDLFDIPMKDLPNVYDGHTPAEVADRLTRFLTKADNQRSCPESSLLAWGAHLLAQEGPQS
jgi:hypothetical protein